MIDYQLLQALSAVITEKGFERASKKLFITQSAVSKRIRQLESVMGTPALVRSHPPKLTAAGQRLLNHLQQVMQLEVALGMANIAEDADYGNTLTVRLATNEDSLATWLPEALVLPASTIKGQFKFELVIEDQSVTLNRMKAGEVMICISSTPEAVNGGAVDYLGGLRYKAVASPQFVKRFGLETDFAQLPVLVFDENDRLQHQFLEDFGHGGPKHIHLCPSSEGFKQSVVAGLGYGLLPELQIGNAIESGELIDLKPGYAIKTPLFWHYWHTESPQLKALRQHALSVAKIKLAQ